MTRSYRALLRGDLRRSFYWHPLFWAPPLAAGWFLALAGRGAKPLAVPALAVFLGVWAARLGFDIPGVACRRW
jgi:hypothetical protein